jgi:hypothetical protein
MNFKDVLTWTIIIYVLYYLIVTGSDLLLKKRVGETTGVDDYSVFKPKDNPHFENPSDYLPTGSAAKTENSEEIEGNGGGSLTEKKKLTHEKPTLTDMIPTSQIKSDFPVYGQPMTLNFLLNDFIAAHEDNCLLRQHTNRLIF